MKIVWNKHNLIISFLVGSGHHDKYLYEIPYENLSQWENRSERIISIKRNHLFNLGLFFKWRFPFSHINRLF